METKLNIEMVSELKELLFELEDRIAGLEASNEILKAHNSIVFNDLYLTDFNERTAYQFAIGFKTYQSLNLSTTDYLNKVEKELHDITEIKEKLYILLYPEEESQE